MIKKEFNHQCKSYWRNDELYDKERKKNFKIKLFGITIWQSSDSYNCDLIDDTITNQIGFRTKK